jgi:hypothetical protein
MKSKQFLPRLLVAADGNWIIKNSAGTSVIKLRPRGEQQSRRDRTSQDRNMKTIRHFNPLILRWSCLAAFHLSAPAASAFDVIAKLERDANANSGPSESACTFCPNTSTQLSVHFNGGFPPPAAPVAQPANTQIVGDAFADLATGVMRGNSFAASYGHNEQHQMRFVSLLRETIDIDLPPGLPVAQRVVTFVGQVTAFANATNRATASAIYSLSVHGVRVAASRHHVDGWAVIDGNDDPAIDITPVMNGGS